MGAQDCGGYCPNPSDAEALLGLNGALPCGSRFVPVVKDPNECKKKTAIIAVF
jgi:hypothetical protein